MFSLLLPSLNTHANTSGSHACSTRAWFWCYVVPQTKYWHIGGNVPTFIVQESLYYSQNYSAFCRPNLFVIVLLMHMCRLLWFSCVCLLSKLDSTWQGRQTGSGFRAMAWPLFVLVGSWETYKNRIKILKIYFVQRAVDIHMHAV